MIIAQRGDFTLNTKSFFGEHQYTTFDIELCRLTENGSRYTIARFEPNDYDEDNKLYYGCNVVSCEGRLFDEDYSIEDLSNIKYLSNLGRKILTTSEKVPSGFKVKQEIYTKRWDNENNRWGEKEVIGYTVGDDV